LTKFYQKQQKSEQKTLTVYKDKGDISQNSKTAKMVWGQYYRMLNFRLALTRLAILNT